MDVYKETMTQTCYRIELQQDLTWHIFTTPATEPSFSEIATVMSLTAAQPAPRFARIFTSDPSTDADWVRRSHRFLSLKSFGNGMHVVESFNQSDPIELNPENLWRCFYPFFHEVFSYGGVVCHSALVEREGSVILLAGPSGRGKSTCCRRIVPPWRVVCDEEAVLIPTGEGSWKAHPMPTWSDIVERNLNRSWDIKQSFPVSAIFFLEWDDSDSAEPVGAGEAALSLARRIREKCFFYYWGLERQEEREIRRRIFDNACELARRIPCYRLKISRTGSFWEEMERVLNVGLV